MAFIIRGSVRGEREVVRALARAEPVFVRHLGGWLGDERARFLGGKNRRGKSYRGYRELLGGKRRAGGRPGTWSRRITSQFKGYMAEAAKIQDLRLTMGVGLQHPKRIHEAIWMLAEGGSTTSAKQMPIPIYRNLVAAGIPVRATGGKVFAGLLHEGRLYGVRKGGKVYYFDTQRQTARGRVRETKPLFIGVHGVSIPAQLTGRYDFYARWSAAQAGLIGRGEKAIDKAVAAVDKGQLN